ncbi:MAG: hypothetical protein Q4D48_04415 [Coriobacteriales bacterium]|nr:hypothetical protein [Coriobacteriales bacterium]
MTKTQNATWYQARKAPFEAFGILYYPLFAHRADLEGVELNDADMAWAVTANTNLEGTGYTLSQPSILALAAYHHHMAKLAEQTSFLPLSESLGNQGVNPLSDIQRLVPNVTVAPMYPDFPSQVMEMDEATFRYHQAMHYLSTYGVELIAGFMGLDVTVSQGWMPDVESTPKTEEDERLVESKVLHLILTVEDLRAVVEARLARATRMHPAEIETAMLVFADLGEEADEASFPKVAFHENMMELIRVASESDSATLARVAGGLAQHPGDLLKATLFLLNATQKGHLATRQKKGLCRAFERFSTMSIAHNIADAGKKERRAPTFLSIERFAGPHLKEACELVWSGKVVSWASELERLWAAVEEAKAPKPAPQPEPKPVEVALSSHKTTLPERLLDKFSKLMKHDVDNKAVEPEPVAQPAEEQVSKPEGPDELQLAWEALLAHYGKRPGMLFRSLTRLAKHGCPKDLLRPIVMENVGSYSLPTLVRTITIMSETSPQFHLVQGGYASWTIEPVTEEEQSSKVVSEIMRELLVPRLRMIDTPLKGKSVHLDTQGISLVGSILMPNDTGDTGTAWPPVGMAYDLPDDQIVRFFTFWDERRNRVDVDLHFIGITTKGERLNIGWNSNFKNDSMVTSGDVTTSTNSVEYLDAHMGKARKSEVYLVVQVQHIYAGATRWEDITTCFSGALAVKNTGAAVSQYNAQNLLFRDDLSGKGTRLPYAIVNFPNHYVRIMRGAKLPIGDVDFTLGDYLAALLEAQECTLAATPDEADVCVCVGRSDDPTVISLFDEGFYLG